MMAPRDILILVPVVPIFPLLVTWWLPWERWLPWYRIPKLFLGPYLMYGAFVAWHFTASIWASLVILAWGGIVCVLGVVELVRKDKSVNVPVPEQKSGITNDSTPSSSGQSSAN